MATMIDRPVAPAGKPPRRQWRRVGLIAAGVLVVAVIGAALGFWRYAATYAPLSSGAFAGPYGTASVHTLVTHPTDLGDEVYLSGPVGTEAQWITTLSNGGGHDVTIQRIETDSLVPKIEWSPYVLRAGGNATGLHLPLRSFPATIPAHHQIRVVLTLRKPPCASGATITIEQRFVHWHALGVDHVYNWPFAGDATYVACPRYIH